jgi:hypothetical protein
MIQSAGKAGNNPPSAGSQSSSALPTKASAEKADADDKVARVSMFITNSQKAQLPERGHSDEEIALMKPAEAHRILGLMN